jgi:hypothetical protein
MPASHRSGSSYGPELRLRDAPNRVQMHLCELAGSSNLPQFASQMFSLHAVEVFGTVKDLVFPYPNLHHFVLAGRECFSNLF